MSNNTLADGIFAILCLGLAAIAIAWYTLSQQSCVEKKEEHIKPPLWVKTNYYKDDHGNCFAYVDHGATFGLAFIPEEACPKDTKSPTTLPKDLHESTDNPDHLLRKAMPATMRR